MSARMFSDSATRRLAIGMLALGIVAILLAGWRALKIEEPRPAAAQTVTVPEIGWRRADADRSLGAVEDDDLFAPDREPPARPYQLVRSTPAIVTPATSKTSRLPNILGTVIGTNGKSFATFVSGASQIKHARIGDTLGGYVVDSILRSRVVLHDAAARRVSVRTTQD